MEKQKRDYGEHREGGPHGYVAEVLDNPENVASANDYTGLTPTPPQNPGQAEGYNDLAAIPQQVSRVIPGPKTPPPSKH